MSFWLVLVLLPNFLRFAIMGDRDAVGCGENHSILGNRSELNTEFSINVKPMPYVRRLA
jgi:hypothetical protein